ncbi:MAG: thioredoxin family protein [Bacteroidales bacterium]
MKRITTLFFTLIVSITLFSQGVLFEKTLDDAFAKAKKENKMVFVDCYTVWCGPCKLISQFVFPTKIAGDYFNPNFVCVKLDCEKGEGIEFAKKQEIVGYPTFFIFKNDGTLLSRFMGGGMDADAFLAFTKSSLLKNEEKDKIKRVYEENKTTANGLAYLEILTHPRERATVAEQILKDTECKNLYALRVFLKSVISRRDLIESSPVLWQILEKFSTDKNYYKDVVSEEMIEYIYSMYLFGSDQNVETLEKLNLIMGKIINKEAFTLTKGKIMLHLAKKDFDSLLEYVHSIRYHEIKGFPIETMKLESEFESFIPELSDEQKMKLKDFYELFAKVYDYYAKEYKNQSDKYLEISKNL